MLVWPVTVYFVRVVDDELEASALINVGFELGSRVDAKPGEEIEIERLPRSLDHKTVEWVAGRFREYVEFARARVQFQAPTGPLPGSRPPGRCRELTDDFLGLIAQQYRAWSAGRGRAVTEIARAHGVNRSTASRWVKAARDRNLLEGGSDA